MKLKTLTILIILSTSFTVLIVSGHPWAAAVPGIALVVYILGGVE